MPSYYTGVVVYIFCLNNRTDYYDKFIISMSTKEFETVQQVLHVLPLSSVSVLHRCGIKVTISY